MKKLKIILLYICLCFLHTLKSQVKFEELLGGQSYDLGFSVKQTFDHGYIAAGSTSSYGYGATDMFLIRTDSMGVIQWEKTYGGINIEQAYSVCQTPDSGFVVLGFSNTMSGFGGYDLYLVRTN